MDDMWRSHATLDEHHNLIKTRARLKLALDRHICQQQELSAACKIFLWLCRRRLHARQTSRRQVCEAALARLRHKQLCSDRAALAEKQNLAAAVACESTLADAAVEQRIWVALTAKRCRHEADMRHLRDSLVDERRYREADNLSAHLMLVEERCHLTDEQLRHEATAQAAAFAERSLAEECGRHDASARADASAELALAEERRAAESTAQGLAEEHCHHDASARAAALAE